MTSRLPDRDLVVGIAQTSSVLGDVVANVAIAAERAAAAAAEGASLVVFPELSLVGYDIDRLTDPDGWITPDDPRLEPLRRTAVDATITIAVGAAVITGGRRRLLALVLLTPDGRELVHAKEHLHGPERDVFHAGLPADQLLEVDGWRVAPAICFDAAVPTHAARAAELGADVYLGSALYVEGEERRVDIHFASRAMDHRMYAVLANHSGPTSIGVSLGGSGVWSPTGDRLVMAGPEPTLEVVRLTPATLAPFRT